MSLMLDEKISKFMGWTIAPCRDYDEYVPERPMALWYNGEVQHVGLPEDWTIEKHLKNIPGIIPTFSTKVNCAMQVVEKMYEFGFGFRVTITSRYSSISRGVTACFFFGVHPPKDDMPNPDKEWYGNSWKLLSKEENMATAICLAALTALEANNIVGL